MRRLRLLLDWLSLPVIAVGALLMLLGNLNTAIALFPQARDWIETWKANIVFASIAAWLSQASMPNWLCAVQTVLLAALFERAYQKLRVHYWLKPPIAFSARIDTTANAAVLLARNQAEQEITDCCATLETATNFSGARMAPLTTIRNNRLRWAGKTDASDDCQIAMPAGKTLSISVAETSNGFQFAACKPSSSSSGALGLYVVRVRVDGKLMGSDMQPQYFDGYLYVEKAKKDETLTLLFEKGDWKKNKRLRKLKR